jgi:23S rRNA (uracil1939-C5)-methyltransferase
LRAAEGLRLDSDLIARVARALPAEAAAATAGVDPRALLRHLRLGSAARGLGLAPERFLFGELAVRPRPAVFLPPRAESLEHGPDDTGAAGYAPGVAAPVSPDQELELRIDSLAYGGNGVARLNGFVVFVRRALPGDVVRARITKVKRNHAEAVSLEVVEPGAPRVEAPCVHYPACGGCRFQDLAYEAQLAAKERQVADALARIGGLGELPLEPAVPAESVFHYRNKLEYSFTTLEDGTVGLGFHRAGRWDEVLDVERCWLTTELGNGIREAVKAWARSEGLPAYDQEKQHGYLRHLVVREGRNTGQALAVLVTAPGDLAGADALVEALRAFPEVRSVHWAVNDTPAEVTNLATDLLWGEEAIEEEILGLRFRLRPNAFLQTNTAMCEVLYRLAAEYAGLTGNETVYDLYSGTGTIGLTLAREALTVWGIESSEESVACAVENAELNGLPNAAFFAGDVGTDLEELRERAGPPDVVVVDPPRAGLAGKALRRVARLEAPRLVYVSCNPTTLAGNAKELVKDFGYRLERARPLDMFPHTPHVETVALFTREPPE